MNEKASCITINCGCCGNGDGSVPTPQTGDCAPVGAVMAYIGLKAPQHYLVCDGAVLNISDYPQLTNHIQAEFGTIDYFGGDGTTTFAVPDMRNEFLRGYHGVAQEQLSGEVGKHQEATNHLGVYMSGTPRFGSRLIGGSETYNDVLGDINQDKILVQTNGYFSIASDGLVNNDDTGRPGVFTSRPTNMAVLYCIKYE